MRCSILILLQAAAAGEISTPPVSPQRTPSDAVVAGDASSSPEPGDATAALARMKTVAKKQKDKIAAQKEEITQLQSQVWLMYANMPYPKISPAVLALVSTVRYVGPTAAYLNPAVSCCRVCPVVGCG